MTADERTMVEFLAIHDTRLSPRQHQAIAICIDERDALLALAHRVHAERGPRKGYMIGTTYWVCDGCGCEDYTREDIPHLPDCLWLAADALLTKNGEAKT